MAQCPQLVVRTKTSKIRYHAGRRGKQVRRGFSGKFLVNINCRTYAWVAQRKSNVLITRRSGFRYSPQAPVREEASAFDLFKRRLRFKENVSGYNRRISFLYGSVVQLVERQTVNLCCGGSSPSIPASTPLGLLGERSLGLSDCFHHN